MILRVWGRRGGIFPWSAFGPPGRIFNKPVVLLVVWRLEWSHYIVYKLVTKENTPGTISNSDLESAGGLLQLEALVQALDMKERTVLSETNNLCTLF